MNYKDTLFFIGKCLTIAHEKHNRFLVEEQLKKGNINWDNIVKVSTSHYVFPALYCNLKRVDFLKYLPDDLVEYMKYITDLNRERNQQIIEQAKEINELLISKGITPVFLKGTGNLLEGLYDDIAERMVGDIDFLVEKNLADEANKILVSSGYTEKISELFDDHRHLPRIVNPNRIAAIEIHKEMLISSKATFFNYDTVAPTLQKTKNIHTLSISDKIKLTIFSKYINDDGYTLKSINLKVAYDVFLIGNKLTSDFIIEESKLSKQLKAGLKINTSVLSKPKHFPELNDTFSNQYYSDFLKYLTSTKNTTKKYLWFSKRLPILKKVFYKKSYFKFVFSRLTDINWYLRKFKPNS